MMEQVPNASAPVRERAPSDSGGSPGLAESARCCSAEPSLRPKGRCRNILRQAASAATVGSARTRRDYCRSDSLHAWTPTELRVVHICVGDDDGRSPRWTTSKLAVRKSSDFPVKTAILDNPSDKSVHLTLKISIFTSSDRDSRRTQTQGGHHGSPSN